MDIIINTIVFTMEIVVIGYSQTIKKISIEHDSW